MKTFLLSALAGLASVALYIGYALFTPLEISVIAALYLLATTPILAGLGGYIGRLVRDFTQPDFILTRGLGDTFNKKLFWIMGPQCVGAFLGMCLTFLGHNALFGQPSYQAEPAQDHIVAAASNPTEHVEVANPVSVPSRVSAAPQTELAPSGTDLVGLPVDGASAVLEADGPAEDVDLRPAAAEQPGVEVTPPVKASPSFDCAAAGSTVERLICGDVALAELDKRLASDYARALQAFSDDTVLIASQNYWLEYLATCSDVECVSREYNRRLVDIANHMKYPQ
jgi:uncharacterized protein YecT (DUF1311 family)